MTYTPKKPIEQEQEELEIQVSKRIDELLSSIKQIGSMYVEPGDVVVVQVDDDASPEMINHLQKVLSTVFKENKGVFVPDNIEFKILKKEELIGNSSETQSQVEQLKQEITQLKEQIQALQELVSTHMETNERRANE